MSETRTVLIDEIGQKDGTSMTGKAWTRRWIKDANGDIYSTFQDMLGGLEKGQKVDIEFELDGKFKNLKSVKHHDNGSAVPETYSAQRPDGETDWDIIGLRKTRCLLWAEFLNSQLAASVFVKSDGDGLAKVTRTGTLLVAAAERDIFERQPGDDGIPF